MKAHRFNMGRSNMGRSNMRRFKMGRSNMGRSNMGPLVRARCFGLATLLVVAG